MISQRPARFEPSARSARFDQTKRAIARLALAKNYAYAAARARAAMERALEEAAVRITKRCILRVAALPAGDAHVLGGR